MAVEEPDSRVVGSESDSGRSTRGNHDDVSRERVHLALDHGRVDGGVVRGDVERSVNDLEDVTVQVEGVLSGVGVVDGDLK